MCIPCVMCGACVDPKNAESIAEGICPECGELVEPDALTCPACFTFLYRPAREESDQEVSEQ